MAPAARKQSGGGGGGGNTKRRIIKTKISSPSPSLSKKRISKTNPNRSPQSSTSSPTTPPPFQPKRKMPLPVIAQAPSPSLGYGKEVVGKRIKVYSLLEKSWYEGCVKSYDEDSRKHLVQYDDVEEELLVLGRGKKIEWVEENVVKKFNRLHRGSSGFRKMVIEDEEMDNDSDGGDVNDDSNDEDWGENVEKEVSEEEDDADLVHEEEEHDNDKKRMSELWKRKASGGGGKLDTGNKGKSGGDVSGGKGELRKRKASGGGGEGKLDLGKKGKSGGDVSGEKGDSRGRKASVGGGGKLDLRKKGKSGGDVSDGSERFSMHEADKLTFLGVERRDAKRRCPGDVDYDPKTLYLPPAFVKSLTGGKKQWWEFKSKHMDKVLFFKMGKFYELFEMDAHIGAKELDLQYMKGDQPHCGFPEKNFMMNVEKLVQKGYRVLVVEQTETPEQLELRRKEKGSKDKVVKREICAMITKGTLTEGELLSANPDASYLMALTESCQRIANQRFERFFGVCVVDVATNRIILGQFGDDAECSSLRSLLSELRPVEIIKPAKVLSSESERVVVRHTRNPLVNELVPLLEFWDANRTVQEVQAICKRICDNSDSGSLHKADLDAMELHAGEDEPSCLPSIVSELVSRGDNGSLALSALGGTLYYLKQAFLDETLLRFAKFDFLPSSNFYEVATKPYMILDAAALENLEIFENSSNGDSSGTLYTQLNHCVTAFGKRLLKTWLATPLYHLGSIKDRQDAVAGLRGLNKPMMLEFRKALSRLPDMERLLARVFSCSEASGRNANKVVIYEDATKRQLQEFITALFGCELMAQACSSLGVILENVESGQLHHLLTVGKGLPDILPIIKHFKDAFDWSEACDSGCIIPHEEADMEYDNACKKVREIESSLTRYLNEQQKLLGDTSITYVTVGKEAYLLEVPEHLRGSVPQNYELRSSKKCFYRYWTPNVKELLGELTKAESEKEATLKSILQRLIVQFCEYHGKWRQLVSATAELDVLTSLAIACDFYKGPTCQPTIIGASFSSEVPRLSAKSLGHPVLSSDTSGKGAFVPNDISVGGSGCASFILLTGPNMGGKSTILRQVCLAVILAQVGADVPAESFELSPVDRIFVRMGAKDHIMAGQSTFLTELSETALMLKSATDNSLVALDELGRGTSTSDGQAIAESVLEHFVHKVQCRGIFSTHYHRLAVDYRKDSKVSLWHMACQVGNGIGGLEKVAFLYRLTPGVCPKSYGVNVARLAGLPDSILQNAAAKSRQFEATYGRRKKEYEENLAIQNCDEIGLFIRTFIKKTKQLNCRQPAGSIDVRLLTKLQNQARLLQQNLSD